jgi:hypothetical protein
VISRILFVLGAFVGVLVGVGVFFISLRRAARAFHASGSVCKAELTALDDTVGTKLAGSARVRLSGASEPENSPKQSILGMALDIGGDQDLLLATFVSFSKASEATASTNVSDYLANQFSSVTPWRVAGRTVWFRAIPADQPATTGTRVDRLDAAIAAGRATFTLELRDGPGPDSAVRARVAELRLTERLPTDEPGFKMSMKRTARGLVPTGFRNGIRFVAYPASQLARGLRGA